MCAFLLRISSQALCRVNSVAGLKNKSAADFEILLRVLDPLSGAKRIPNAAPTTAPPINVMRTLLELFIIVLLNG